jgi:hypothetical protein|tara:strand:- start:18 stop:125 length:108 start_codon:yes stop_codon:yes gene_type:complete
MPICKKTIFKGNKFLNPSLLKLATLLGKIDKPITE